MQYDKDSELTQNEARIHEDVFFFFQAEDGIRDLYVTGVQTCALPIFDRDPRSPLRTVARDNLDKQRVCAARPLLVDGGGPNKIAVDDPGRVGLQGGGDGCPVDTLDPQDRKSVV